MAALGAPPEMARAIAARTEEEPPVEVWSENEAAVLTFLAMDTQWRRAGMSGIPTGLDYTVLPVVCRAHRRRLDANLLGRLGVIETAAITAMLERRRG